MQQMIKMTLKAARVNAKLSSKDAAKALGICTSTLKNYESGRTEPSWTVVKKMEKVYGVPCDVFFFG